MSKAKTKWKVSTNRKNLPKKRGLLLFMTTIGTFFVGRWEPDQGEIFIQSLGFKVKNGKRMATGGAMGMVWDFEENPTLCWRKVDDNFDYYEIYDAVGLAKQREKEVKAQENEHKKAFRRLLDAIEAKERFLDRHPNIEMLDKDELQEFNEICDEMVQSYRICSGDSKPSNSVPVDISTRV